MDSSRVIVLARTEGATHTVARNDTLSALSYRYYGDSTLHARILYGSNDHHKAEALFKALGKALDRATIIDPRISGELPTTKGYLQS